MSGKTEFNFERKNYVKPQIEQVKLVSDEAVLQTCKRGGENGPGEKNCKRGFQACYQKGRS
ncbi:MAG: hypothetical protein HXY53_07255 [Nitrospirae bacterium]|nr:hypothetical protein [Nitrospirota bacterium]